MSESKRGDAMSTPSTMGADLCRLLLLLFWGIIDGMASGFSIMKQSYSNVAFFAIIACVAYIAVAAAMPPPPPPPSPTVS